MNIPSDMVTRISGDVRVPVKKGDSVVYEKFVMLMANMVVYNDPAPATGTSPVVPGLATSHVNLAVTFTDGVPTAMTVSLTGFSFTTIFGTTTLNGKPLARYAFQGLYAPAGSF